MKYIFFLSGDYAELGKEEILSLFGIGSYKYYDRLLIADLGGNEKEVNEAFKRLALTKNIYKYLFECKTTDLIGAIKGFDWNSVYKDDFCLRVYNFNDDNSITKRYIDGKNNKNKIDKKIFSEKSLAGCIWRNLEKPKVNLENTKTPIQIFMVKNKAYCGLLVYENDEDFESRKPHLRPFPHPSSLHPKVARALVNLAGIGENGALLDPFCGTGGILIEAGLMNLSPIGYDIDKIMLDGCARNLKHFKIRNFKIRNKDAVSIGDKFDYVVTDLPY